MPVDTIPLFRRFADLRPRPPGNGLSGKSQRTAVTGELIQKRIGRGVVCLTRIAHDADPAREKDKHIQIPVHSRLVQMPGAQYLRPEHGFESLPILVGQRAVRQHAHAVDHASERG